jgi:hypothetical protein
MMWLQADLNKKTGCVLKWLESSNSRFERNA